MNTTIIIILIIAFGFVGMGLLLIKLQRVNNENIILHKAVLEKQELLNNREQLLNDTKEELNKVERAKILFRTDAKNALDKFNICETDLNNVKAKLIVAEELVETKHKALMELRKNNNILNARLNSYFGINLDNNKNSIKILEFLDKLFNYILNPTYSENHILVKKIKNNAEYKVISYRFNIKTNLLDLGVLPSNIEKGTVKYLPISDIIFV
jgi:hypothetical protein